MPKDPLCPRQYGSYDVSTCNCPNCGQGFLYQVCRWQDGDHGPGPHSACAGWNIDGEPHCCEHWKKINDHKNNP